MISFETEIEIEVEVEADVTGSYTPARLTADPYYSTPAEGPDIDFVGVYIVKYDQNGHELDRLDISDFVDCEQFDDQIFEQGD